MGSFAPAMLWEAPKNRTSETAGPSTPAGQAAHPGGSVSAELALSHSGRPLPPDLRRSLERSFGSDFDSVRVHSDPQSQELSATNGADALTAGHDVFFARGRYRPETLGGRVLIAHELAHVAQGAAAPTGPARLSSPDDAHERAASEAAMVAGAGQAVDPARLGGAPGGMLHRYKSFEHAEAGLIGSYIGPEYTDYTVKKGELPAAIASKLGVAEADILAANRPLLRRWRTRSGHVIVGFEAGVRIKVPTGRLVARTPAKGEAPSAAPNTIKIAGADVPYDELLPMADFYANADDLLKADPAEFKRLRDLVKAEAKSPTSVTEDMWDTATGGRYMDLNRANREHFSPAPGSPLTVAPGLDNRSSWHFYHNEAIKAARAGDLNRALAINAFADHFLQDAFAAGHLIDKAAVMAGVASQLSTDKQIEDFAAAVAADAWKFPIVVTECARYEGHKDWVPGWWDINSPSRLASIFERIGKTPRTADVLPNAIAGAIHDDLNRTGVEVRNSLKTWTEHGDGSMGPDDLDMMRRAVAESYVQVVNADKTTTPPATLDKAVWDLVPVPTTTGQAAVVAAVARLSTVTSAAAIHSVAEMVRDNIAIILRRGAAEAPANLKLK